MLRKLLTLLASVTRKYLTFYRTLRRKHGSPELTDEECADLLHDWEWLSRPNQREPANFTDGAKSTWLVIAGRGFGKTRVGAEWVRSRIKKSPYVNLIGRNRLRRT